MEPLRLSCAIKNIPRVPFNHIAKKWISTSFRQKRGGTNQMVQYNVPIAPYGRTYCGCVHAIAIHPPPNYGTKQRLEKHKQRQQLSYTIRIIVRATNTVIMYWQITQWRISHDRISQRTGSSSSNCIDATREHTWPRLGELWIRGLFWWDHVAWVGPARVVKVESQGIEVCSNGCVKTATNNRIRWLRNQNNTEADDSLIKPDEVPHQPPVHLNLARVQFDTQQLMLDDDYDIAQSPSVTSVGSDNNH